MESYLFIYRDVNGEEQKVYSPRGDPKPCKTCGHDGAGLYDSNFHYDAGKKLGAFLFGGVTGAFYDGVVDGMEINT